MADGLGARVGDDLVLVGDDVSEIGFACHRAPYGAGTVTDLDVVPHAGLREDCEAVLGEGPGRDAEGVVLSGNPRCGGGKEHPVPRLGLGVVEVRVRVEQAEDLFAAHGVAVGDVLEGHEPADHGVLGKVC